MCWFFGVTLAAAAIAESRSRDWLADWLRWSLNCFRRPESLSHPARWHHVAFAILF